MVQFQKIIDEKFLIGRFAKVYAPKRFIKVLLHEYWRSYLTILLITCNSGHNILELYNIFVQVGFDTSKTKLAIWYNKLDVRVVSRVLNNLITRIL